MNIYVLGNVANCVIENCECAETKFKKTLALTVARIATAHMLLRKPVLITYVINALTLLSDLIYGFSVASSKSGVAYLGKPVLPLRRR